MKITVINANRILIAEPSESTLRFSSAIAESLDVRVIAAADGREAYRILHEDQQFIAVFYNLVMPHLDAPELIKYMKSERRLTHIPIVVATNKERFHLINECQRAGVHALLQKPYTPSQFASMLGLLISQKQKVAEQRGFARSHLRLAPIRKSG